MKRPFVAQTFSSKLLASAIMTVATGIGGSYAVAQSSATPDAQQRYRADVERCRSGQTSQDEQTCLREAGAALEEARRNRLVTGTPSFEENQRARCDRLSGAERDDCLLLMSDTNATVHGSVDGGGVLRETTITIPADSTMQPPASGGMAPAGTSAPTYGTPSTPYTPAPAGGLAPAAPAPGSAPAGGLTPAR